MIGSPAGSVETQKATAGGGLAGERGTAKAIRVHSRVMADQVLSVVVSGAASGMGGAVATRFVAEGWRVLALDVDVAGLARLHAEVGTGSSR